jgi:hypothetical protein
LIEAEQNALSKERIKILNQRISNYQGIIQDLNNKYAARDSAYKAEVKLWESKEGILKDNIGDLNKNLIKERRRTRRTIIGGIITTAGALYLGLRLH